MMNVSEQYRRLSLVGRRCDACRAVLPPGRTYRCAGCKPPPLPQVARDAIELAKRNAERAREERHKWPAR